MNILRHEFKAHRKALFWWSFGVFWMCYAGMAKYGGFSATGQDVTKLFGQMPKSVMAVFGMTGADLTTALGFYTILYIYVFVMTAIHASLLGASILAEEEIDRTAEFLYPKPASRTRILAEKLGAAVLTIVILNLVTAFFSVVFTAMYNKNGPSATPDILLMMVGMLLASLLFFSVGLAAAAVVKKPRLAAPISSGYMFLAFFLKVYLDITEKTQGLKYLTPYKYFEGPAIAKEGALDPLFVVLSIALIGVFTGAAFYAYERRDLKV